MVSFFVVGSAFADGTGLGTPDDVGFLKWKMASLEDQYGYCSSYFKKEGYKGVHLHVLPHHNACAANIKYGAREIQQCGILKCD